METQAPKAVFLSYASQDTDAARRIAETLRAAGVEVWFDQSELRGGDAWDQKIRRQIQECALFLPVISATTQTRLEGYFRIEWKLAAQRTYAMAEARPFLLPIVIDGTRDAEAHVPPEFKTVQWTRLPNGETAKTFVERIRALLVCGLVAGGADPRGSRAEFAEQKPGDRIGHYRLLEKIGEGGCGIVWRAEQEEPVRRRVALKVIKLGMDTKEVIARFEVERQALAMMDHPNIAKVFDAGTTDRGRPYFVMELVQGVPITTFCDERKTSTAARLELFTQVCHAVQHAHQKGIIHRDLKPSNILVALHDDVPVPKVIDFGIAKATAGRLTDQTLFTAVEQFMGTPAYMSPEQAQVSAIDIDTRSDIYALGVLLYELLTGRTPFDTSELLKIGIDEMRRQIREVDPPRPSTRLSTMQGEALNAAALRREIAPPKLIHLIRGDLDWIVMRCLEKDRGRRYETANALAADVRHHLNSQPVSAGPPSVSYRTGKFVRRHRFGVAAAAGLVVLLTAFAVTMALQARRIARERDRADQEATVSRQVSDFLIGLFKISDPGENRGSQITAREILNRGAERIDQELVGQPLLQARLMSTMGEVYRSLGLYEPAGRLLEGSLAKRQQLLGTGHELVAESLTQMGTLLWYRGDYQQAEKVLHRALDLRRKLLGPEHPEVATTLNVIGNVLSHQGNHRDAETVRREVLAIYRRAYKGDHSAVAISLNNLAIELKEQRKNDEAEPLYQDSLAMTRRLFGTNHPAVAQKINNLGMFHLDRARFANDNRRRASDLTAAESLLREGLEIHIRIHGEPHPEVTSGLNNLGLVLIERAAFEEAERVFRRALDRAPPDDRTRCNLVQNNLAGLLMRTKRPLEAEPLYRRVLDYRTRVFSRDNWQVASVESQLGECLVAQQRFAEAEALIVGAYTRLQPELGDAHPATKASASRIPKLYDAWGKPAEAAKWRGKLAVEPKK